LTKTANRPRSRQHPTPKEDRAPSLLELEGVTKLYRRGDEEVAALRNVDFAVEPGEFVAISGPSGSGKSTLLQLAAGFDTPTAGRVMVEGRNFASMSFDARARLRRRRVGFVFQFFHLIPTLTLSENVALPLVFDGQRHPEGRAAAALERVGLAHRARHRPGELSGGEMQRGAIARALVIDPALVLADEPTGNLDSSLGAEVLDLLTAQVREVDAGLVVATHDSSAVERADRVLFLKDGMVQ
jgi:putative ABC transport system ATP-binding protein